MNSSRAKIYEVKPTIGGDKILESIADYFDEENLHVDMVQEVSIKFVS